jgi:hypothetical protein
MAESVVLTKSTGEDYQIVVDGIYDYTKQFPAADYVTNVDGVKLVPRAQGDILMFKHYAPDEWTVGIVTGFSTNKEVTDAITALENS